jgi:hypothetical protein
VSVLEGFLTTLASARATFGEGVPDHFDGEALSKLHDDVAGAAPGPHWSGQAANAYEAVNAEHVQTLSRQELDALRQWVVDLAGSLPAEVDHDQELTPVVQQATRQLTDVVTRSNAELNAIGARIQGFGAEYAALSRQRFGKS